MKLIPKKSLGQNFLTDQSVVNLIVDTAKIEPNDTIIEVGPGMGILTEKILRKEPKVFSVIEKDERLIEILNQKFENKINIINEDMLKISYEKFVKENTIIFGNLPYNISIQMLTRWIKMKNLDKTCKKLVLMFQKEVADRIIAKFNTKSYGRLSIISNWKMKVDKIKDIEPTSFNPMPKVRSTLLVLKPKKNFYPIKDPKNLEYVTNIFFNQRRKMIKKPLKFLFNNFEQISKKLSLDLKLRPQNLDFNTYFNLTKVYEQLRG